MNQRQWIIQSDTGKNHLLGIMHGPKTGHLLVYLNSKIMLIDFKILDDKSYSFFIDDELCEFIINKEDPQHTFSYELKLDTHTATPKNVERNKIKRRELFLILGLLIIVGGGLVFGLSYLSSKNKEKKWSELPRIGKITAGRMFNQEGHWRYQFVVGSNIYQKDFMIGKGLIEGNIQVIYHPADPNINKIFKE